MRRCVFCGGNRLTNEHVIPRWLTDILPEQLRWRGQDQRIVLRPSESDPSTMLLPHREVREPFNEAKVKSVCASCNSGWMNAIESAARPTIAALVRGEQRELKATDVEAVATWAIKTSLMVQLTSTYTAAALGSTYGDFFRDRKPPANAVVWAASVHGEDWGLRAEAMSLLVATEDDPPSLDDPPNTLAVTLGLGSLLLHSILTSRPSVSYPPLDQITSGGLVPFWPNVATTRWPPRRQLDNEMAWLVSHSLADWLIG